MNVAAINGTWQAISFLNFYIAEYGRDTNVPCDIILFEINEDFENVCREIFVNFSFINKVTIFKDFKEKKVSYDNLWIGKLFSINAKSIINHFPGIPINLFEEGLHSYVNSKKFNFINLFRLQTTIKSRLSLFKHYFRNRNIYLSQKEYKHLILPWHEKRVAKKYFLLPLVEKSEKNIVNNGHISFVIDKIKNFKKTEITIDKNQPTVCIVGQGLSTLNLISFEEELKIYIKLINHYKERGYRVIWKGHPRVQKFDEIIKSDADITILDHSYLPLEFFTLDYDGLELCGISSSSLLYNKYIFKRTTTQAAFKVMTNLDKNNIWYSDFMEIFKLIDKNILPVKI